MSAPSTAEIRAEKRVLAQQMAALTAQLGKAKATASKKAKAEAKMWVLTAEMRKAVLAMYVLADYSPEPAARYLLERGQERRSRLVICQVFPRADSGRDNLEDDRHGEASYTAVWQLAPGPFWTLS